MKPAPTPDRVAYALLRELKEDHLGNSDLSSRPSFANVWDRVELKFSSPISSAMRSEATQFLDSEHCLSRASGSSGEPTTVWISEYGLSVLQTHEATLHEKKAPNWAKWAVIVALVIAVKEVLQFALSRWP